MKQILPGIVRVFVCECGDVPQDSDLMGVAGGVQPIISEVEEQPIYGVGELSVERTRDGAMGYETATLTYRSEVDLGRNVGLCYCVRDVNGVDYLVGSAVKGVRISSVRRGGTPGGEPAGWEHTVKYSDVKALQECFVTG